MGQVARGASILSVAAVASVFVVLTVLGWFGTQCRNIEARM